MDQGRQLLAAGGAPVVLAPMAGITNRAFRRLARELVRASGPPGPTGIYVTEMVTSRALVEGRGDTWAMLAMEPDESPRSVQLYGVDPAVVGAAVRLVVAGDHADHVDLNFGCPVPKVTRKGGGAALPWKRDLFRDIVRAAVGAAREVAAADGREPVPVTVKMRKGIDQDHQTSLEAGRIAAQEGAAWVALHGRTAAQYYGGSADWSAIARLVDALEPYGVPVLGNGDVWTADDALAMVRATGCAGVVVGRGCLGRPWLFAALHAAFAGRPVPPEPDLRGVTEVMRRHAGLLVDVFGDRTGVRDFRKHHAWYLKGFRVGSETRRALGLIDTLDDLDRLLDGLDLDQSYDDAAASQPRGRTTADRRVALPEGWLASPLLAGGERAVLREAELAVSGG